MKKTLFIILTVLFSLNAQALFEIKDASDNTVFSIAEDGLRVFNLGDTLMVISATEIKANISDGKGKALSRSFSVTTSTTGKAGLANVLEVTTGATKMREGAAGYQFTDFSPDNIFIGLNSGINSIPIGPSGMDNIFIGNESGLANEDGYSNIFIGSRNGITNTSGYNNVFIGNEAGSSNTTGSSNVFIGLEAGSSSNDKLYNTYVGTSAGKSSDGDGNTFVGYASGYDNTIGYNNSFFGDNSGKNNGEGYYNSVFGHEASANNSGGVSNSVFGYLAGEGATGATYNYNCLFGTFAGKLLDTGSSNVMMGYYTGYSTTTGSNNVYLGEKSGHDNQTGGGNIFIGYNAGYYETGSDRIYIDNSGTEFPLIFGAFDSPRQVVIDGNDSDNTNDRKFFVYGTAGGTSAWYNDSDKRKKKNIKTIDSSLDKVMKLRGVTFEWDAGEKYETGKQMGFVAQEAEKVIPEVVDYNEKNDSYGMQYAPINALLVEAIKEQQKKIEELERKLEEVNKKLNK